MARRLPEWEEVVLSLTDGMLTSVECFDEGATTMDLARVLSSRIETGQHGLVMLERQTQGRGRRGRSWVAPRVPFTGTFVTKAMVRPEALAGLSLVVGIAVSHAVRELGAETKLKWPNDILSPLGKKLGGILIEVALQEDGVSILTGIGVNIAGVPADMEYPVASLEELTKIKVTPPELGACIARSLVPHIELFLKEGFGYFKDEWLALGPVPGSIVTVSAAEGRWSGSLLGVTSEGALLIQSESRGVVTVHSGEVTIE